MRRCRGAIHCDQFVGAVSRGRNELRPYIQPFIGVGLSGVARRRNELGTECSSYVEPITDVGLGGMARGRNELRPYV